MSGRPRRACDKCSSQKLRCSGQRPSCQRCIRLRRPCRYDGTDSVTRPSTPASGVSFEPPTNSLHKISIPKAVPEQSYVGIPSRLIPALLDVYWCYMYNASLLLHRTKFLDALAAETVRPDTLLSICALASKFYRDVNGGSTLLESGFGLEWAERASQIAFQRAEIPQEENIVGLINLALFWYSNGDWQRSGMHVGTAVQTARLLSLAIEQQSTTDSLKREMQRRRFWACYLTDLFSPESSLPKEPSEAILNLPLPCDEEAHELGIPRDPITLSSGQSHGSVYAELLRAMALWSAVHLIVNQPKSSPASHLAAIQSLDARINTWWATLPGQLYIDLNDLSSIPDSILPRVLLVHVVYHTCLCALHASLVPLFSWSSNDDASLYVRRLSGQIAMDHANGISSILEAALSYSWDARRLPSFTGYAAYCASAIQMPFMCCSDSEIRQRAYANVFTNLRAVHLLGNDWKFIAILGINARALYEVRVKQANTVHGEPRDMDAAALNGFGLRAARVRSSILTHNEILHSKEGAVAKRSEDVPDLGLDDFNSRKHHVGSSEIGDFLSEISSTSHAGNVQVPSCLPQDPFQAGINVSSWELGVPCLMTGEFMANNPTDSFENWIGDWMQEQV